jgi:hypothetical protein
MHIGWIERGVDREFPYLVRELKNLSAASSSPVISREERRLDHKKRQAMPRGDTGGSCSEDHDASPAVRIAQRR